MKRRQFTSRLAAGAALGALGPVSASFAGSISLHDCPIGACWQTSAACLADLDTRFEGTGPVDGEFVLKSVEDRGNHGRGPQFIASFQGPADAPDGVYRLRAAGRDLVLYLQAVGDGTRQLNAIITLLA